MADRGGRRGRGQPRGVADAPMDLQKFFPYRLAILAENVSLAVAEIYAVRFSLTRWEWRVLAALGGSTGIAARDIGRITTLDKMQVSRAMRALEARGVVTRSEAPGDKRQRMVRLTPEGRALYREIVPLARDREAAILAVLAPAERQALDDMIARISQAAAGLRGSQATPTG